MVLIQDIIRYVNVVSPDENRYLLARRGSGPINATYRPVEVLVLDVERTVDDVETH